MTNRSWWIVLINLILLASVIAFVVIRMWKIGPENIDLPLYYKTIKYSLGLNIIGGIAFFIARKKDLALGFLFSLVAVGLTWYFFGILASYLWEYL